MHVEAESNYPVSASKIESSIKGLLKKKGKDNVSLVVVLTGEKKMKELGSEYLGEKDQNAHNVLSFPARETKIKLILPPQKLEPLGEVIVCYPRAQEDAKEEGVGVEEKVIELALHGTLHLLGEHHK